MLKASDTQLAERLMESFILLSGGPDEKDRQLLVEFDKVIEEFQILSQG
jgi:hypothetical protein